MPWVIAHRGASGYAPENTLAAFQRAVELGVGFIEADLHLTRDARFVAMHDDTLDRTTSGHGAVHDFTLAELRELDAGLWFDRQFSDERIPTIEDILAFSEKYDVIFYLDAKYNPAWGMHHALAGALRDASNAARTVVISFDPSVLEALRRLDPSVMTGLLFVEGEREAIKASLEVGARQLCPRADLVTREFVEQAHRTDLSVATWTANQADEMRSLIAAGVDGIMTDFPDRLRAILEP